MSPPAFPLANITISILTIWHRPHSPLRILPNLYLPYATARIPPCKSYHIYPYHMTPPAFPLANVIISILTICHRPHSPSRVLPNLYLPYVTARMPPCEYHHIYIDHMPPPVFPLANITKSILTICHRLHSPLRILPYLYLPYGAPLPP